MFIWKAGNLRILFGDEPLCAELGRYTKIVIRILFKW